MNEYFSEAGNFVARDPDKVDPRMRAILREAAHRAGRRVEAFSGYRPGDPRFHGKGMATDIRLFDDKGGVLGNYQDPATFSEYEKFAQKVREVQMEMHPDLNDKLRWGGYFSGGKGQYGALDQMHFDIGGSEEAKMLGGSWAAGLTPEQRKRFPGITSAGMTLTSTPLPNQVGAVPATVAPPPARPPGSENAAHGVFQKTSAARDAAYGGSWKSPPTVDVASLGTTLMGADMLNKGIMGTPTELAQHQQMRPMSPEPPSQAPMAAQMLQALIANKRRPRGLTLGM